ncbi:3-hydroxyisobutyrate dehydrogenase [Xanthobacter dioxanivorans]|uniref:3-hydroxyisobutyrate dehydrogenase n=2 Tax=Xanthobacter dioxanivorans TaxID=2528964 RepID=A0A974SJL5_9HYPH|nr:3-hydroxyisobutyrate dehydrogenase [Xanthobacter dioxanivorans]
MKKIAFIGLGNMGFPMAANLVRAGYEVGVYDLSADAVSRLASEGARAGRSPLDAADGADAVITMLPNGKIVCDLYLGPEGLIHALQDRPLLIDCSTIAPETARTVAAEAAAAGFSMLDAPVSGGPPRAAEGTLSFMVGGSGEALDAARPVLEKMGRFVFHAGGNGAGQAAKICNNMLAAVAMAGTAEVMELGVRNGLDPAVLSAIIQKSSGNNFVLERWNPWPGVLPEAPASKGYAPGFQLALMLKDLGLALDNARANGASVPMGALAQSLYALRSKEDGAGASDFSCIQTLYSRGA